MSLPPLTRTKLLGVLITSLALLVFEIALTRIFSVVLWYHFAFLAISLALFGLGAGGLLLHFFPERFPREGVDAQNGPFRASLRPLHAGGFRVDSRRAVRLPRLPPRLRVPLVDLSLRRDPLRARRRGPGPGPLPIQREDRRRIRHGPSRRRSRLRPRRPPPQPRFRAGGDVRDGGGRGGRGGLLCRRSPPRADAPLRRRRGGALRPSRDPRGDRPLPDRLRQGRAGERDPL